MMPVSPARQCLAVGRNHRDPCARDRPAHRARPHRKQRGAIADQQIGLGLAVELVDRDAERLARPTPVCPRRAPRRRSPPSAGRARSAGAARRPAASSSARSAAGRRCAPRAGPSARRPPRDRICGRGAPARARRNRGSAAARPAGRRSTPNRPASSNRSPGCGKKSCGSCTPGRWPSSTRCACSAPFGFPVVPEV